MDEQMMKLKRNPEALLTPREAAEALRLELERGKAVCHCCGVKSGGWRYISLANLKTFAAGG